MANWNADSAYLSQKRTMAARYPGTCRRCLLAIITGHTIQKVAGGWAHFRCSAGKPDPNIEWARMKNEFARHEREQENAAYEAEMRAEAELFEKHEGMPPS